MKHFIPLSAGLLAAVLLLIELLQRWIIATREPEKPNDYSPEDVPVIEIFSAGGVTMFGYMDKDGKWTQVQK